MSSNEVEIRITGSNQSGAALAAARKDAKGLADTVGETGKAYAKTSKEASGFAAAAKSTAKITAGILSADLIREGAKKAVEGIKSTIEAASSLGESVNAVGLVFKANSKEIEDWGKANSESYGLSLRAFNSYATPLGAMLKNAGMSEQQVTEQTIKLTERAADMASVFNVDVGTALEAIQAGLRGESDPLEKFGVGLSAAKVQARALADSGKANASALTSQELAMARLNIIYDQTNDTAGDFKNTSTGLANATRTASAAMEDAKANIGAAFLPVLSLAAQATGKFASAMGKLPGPVATAAVVVASLAGAFVFLSPKVKAAKEVLDGMSASMPRLSSGMGTAARAIGVAGAALAVIGAAGQASAAIFGHELNPQVDALADSLMNFTKTGKTSGEMARLFGGDTTKLKRDLLELTSGTAGFARFTDSITGGLGGADFSITKSTERTKAYDSALAGLVTSGHAEEAAANWQLLKGMAEHLGIPLEKLTALFPEYGAAMQLAGKKTKETGDAAKTAATDFDALDSAFHATIDAAFALGDSEDKVADDIARLTDQVKSQKSAHDKGAASLDRNTQAGRDNAAMLRSLVGDTADLAVQNQKAGKSNDGLKAKLEAQLRAMGFSSAQISEYTGQLDGMIAQLNAIPKIVVSNVYIKQHGSAPNLGYTHGDATGGIGGGSYPYAASGGLPRQGGTPTMMNEQGSELVHLPWGATVYSAGQSKSMAQRGDMLDGRGPGGGGGSREIIIRGDGSPIAEGLIQVLAMAVSAKGGRPGILGIRI